MFDPFFNSYNSQRPKIQQFYIQQFSVQPNNTPTVSLTADLIRRQSVTPNDAGCQELIASRLKPLGFEFEYFDKSDVSNLWARRGKQAPLLVFVGHTDVVPVGDESSWNYPPFDAVVADDMVHGRGAADMKGSIAAMICACERFFEYTSLTSGSIAFLITSDEEGVAVNGTRYVMEVLMERNDHIDYCLVGEPTSEKRLGDTIKIGRRGSLCCELTIVGKQGHVAYPHLADNPIHRSGALIERLTSIEWTDGDEHFPNTTLQISNIHSGVGVGNVIPGSLQMSMNYRFSPASDPQSLMDAVENECKALGLNYHAVWDLSAESYRTEKTSFADMVSQATSDTLCSIPKRSTTGGTSDGRFVAKCGAQVVEFGPLNDTIHKVNECVSVKDLNDLSLIYERIMQISLSNS